MSGGGSSSNNTTSSGSGDEERDPNTPIYSATFQPMLPGHMGLLSDQLMAGYGSQMNQGELNNMLSGLYKPMSLTGSRGGGGDGDGGGSDSDNNTEGRNYNWPDQPWRWADDQGRLYGWGPEHPLQKRYAYSRSLGNTLVGPWGW